MRERIRTISWESTWLLAIVGFRWVATAVVVLAFLSAYQWIPGLRYFVDHSASLLAMGDFHALKMFILSFGWWAPVVSAILMIVQTLVAPLPAFILAIANAMAFGVFYGFILTCGSAFLAAFLAFYLARWLGRPFVERWMSGWTLDSWIEKYGGWGVLLLRLFPVVSFDFVSFAAGLTLMRPAPFGIATILGMIPAALAFSLLGESIETASRWSLLGGLVLFLVLLFFSLLIRRSGMMRR